MSLETVMHNFSFTLLRGGTQKIKDIMNNKPNSGGFALHYGFGINFARILYEAEQKQHYTGSTVSALLMTRKNFPADGTGERWACSV